MKSLRWIQLTLRIPSSYQDLLIGQLAAVGIGGFLQEDIALHGFIAESKWNRGLQSRLEYCLRQFGKEFPQLNLRFSSTSVRQQNWNKKWERSIGILEAAPGIVIKPSWKRLRVRDKGKIILRIDPKMSFGTGHHESTRLCLQFLREYIQPHMTVLDFGSGTGILAIAAIKLGAGRVVAVDNDPWTMPNIKENLKRNLVTNKVKVILGGIEEVPKSSYDLIAANIDLPTIAKVYVHLIRRLNKRGLLVFSGLLTTDLLPLHRLIRHSGISPLNIIEENEWSAIALVRV